MNIYRIKEMLPEEKKIILINVSNGSIFEFYDNDGCSPFEQFKIGDLVILIDGRLEPKE